MRALVTGRAGFIGSHLGDALLADGADVAVLDDLSTGSEGKRRSTGRSVGRRRGRPQSRGQRRRGARRRVPPGRPPRRAPITRASAGNRPGQRGRHLERAPRRSRRRRAPGGVGLVVHGLRPDRQLPTPEDAPTRPRSPYAVSKLAAEHYGRVFSELFGLETVSLRRQGLQRGCWALLHHPRAPGLDPAPLGYPPGAGPQRLPSRRRSHTHADIGAAARASATTPP